jgi:hypothetical protein
MRIPSSGSTAHNTRFTRRALRALAAQMVHKSLHVKGADNQLSAQLAFARSAPPLVVVNLCTLSEMSTAMVVAGAWGIAPPGSLIYNWWCVRSRKPGWL